MKKLLILLSLCLWATVIMAQSEVQSDSTVHISFDQVKRFDGFLIDMDLMTLPKGPELPSLTDIIGFDLSKDYNALFKLDTDIIYNQTYVNGIYPNLGYGFHSNAPSFLNAASIKLNDNLQLNLYGQYSADGKRMRNHSALPWEKNNFKGGMELKNKNFGIRIEVERGNKGSHPFY